MLPLAGVTVVALEHAVAAPFATRQLADLGARVIKIERPGVGDFARNYDESVAGMASYFVWLNRSKESVALDVKTPEGRRILHELVDGADVLVQNLGPGAVGRLGLGDVRSLLPPIGLTGSEARMDPVPALGQHTTAVLAELGHSPADIDRLRAAGTLGKATS